MEAEFRPLGDASGDAAAHDPTDTVPAPGAARSVAALAEPANTATETATLAQLSRHLIDQTLAACSGNVSQAARRLGVSRGLLYRRLRQT
jgi:transcriptional regulator of acetoin/glycerol metabolism